MKKRDAKKVVNINDSISSDGEETGAQDLEGLSLPELEILFDRELVESDRLQAESDCLSRRSVESLFRAGRVLAAIRDRLKSQRKWTEWQNDHKVGTTSAWQAIKLFEAAGSEEAVADLTRTEALIKFGITERCAEK
jgi:glycerol-3-phosphate dehydrogenase